MDITSKDFRAFKNIDDAINRYAEKISHNFDFLSCQRQTGFHEVDIKRFEARQCVAFELGISAIVMVCVTLEECLKTLLKYHHFNLNVDKSKTAGLEDWGKASISAEDAFGTFRLHNAIQKARKENLITPEEESKLLKIKDFIRNAFIHSDKSKLFDANQTMPVDRISVEDGAIKFEERLDMSILGLNIAQGIAEKKIANENCMAIFKDVDQIIVTVCERFWTNCKQPEKPIDPK